MLPFLKQRRQTSGVIIQERDPVDSGTEEKIDEEIQALEGVASDLLSAIESKDTKKIAESLKAAFSICETYPHEEGEHIDEELGEEE